MIDRVWWHRELSSHNLPVIERVDILRSDVEMYRYFAGRRTLAPALSVRPRFGLDVHTGRRGDVRLFCENILSGMYGDYDEVLVEREVEDFDFDVFEPVGKSYLSVIVSGGNLTGSFLCVHKRKYVLRAELDPTFGRVVSIDHKEGLFALSDDAHRFQMPGWGRIISLSSDISRILSMSSLEIIFHISVDEEAIIYDVRSL